MGLDMYLFAKRHVFSWGEDEELAKKIADLFPGMEDFQVDCVRFQIAYWRKANSIHGWFVRNVQEDRDDCQESYVELDKLEELYKLVTRLLEERDEGLAAELLPSVSGFFFGSVDYNEDYWQDLQDTKDQLDLTFKRIMLLKLKGASIPWDFYYQASW
jgi:hypothetical protein